MVIFQEYIRVTHIKERQRLIKKTEDEKVCQCMYTNNVCKLKTEFFSVKRLYSIFAEDLAAVRIIEMFVIARCPQGES